MNVVDRVLTLTSVVGKNMLKLVLTYFQFLWFVWLGCLFDCPVRGSMACVPFFIRAIFFHRWTTPVFIIFISLEAIILECHCLRFVLDAHLYGKRFMQFGENMTNMEVCCSGFRRYADNWRTLGGVFCRSFSVVRQQSWQGINKNTNRLMIDSGCETWSSNEDIHCLWLLAPRSVRIGLSVGWWGYNQIIVIVEKLYIYIYMDCWWGRLIISFPDLIVGCAYRRIPGRLTLSIRWQGKRFG